MAWDFEDMVWWTVGLIVLSLYLWAKYISGRSMGWGDGKARAFAALSLCAGLFLIGMFEVAAEFVVPAQIVGTISHTDLRPSGKGDHSNFDVRSPDGRVAKVASGHHFVERLETGENVEVLYNRWTSFPYEVERLDGAERELLLENGRHDVWDWVLLLGAAVAGVYHFRKFKLAGDES
jgi:hypothetical protein